MGICLGSKDSEKKWYSDLDQVKEAIERSFQLMESAENLTKKDSSRGLPAGVLPSYQNSVSDASTEKRKNGSTEKIDLSGRTQFSLLFFFVQFLLSSGRNYIRHCTSHSYSYVQYCYSYCFTEQTPNYYIRRPCLLRITLQKYRKRFETIEKIIEHGKTYYCVSYLKLSGAVNYCLVL